MTNHAKNFKMSITRKIKFYEHFKLLPKLYQKLLKKNTYDIVYTIQKLVLF